MRVIKLKESELRLIIENTISKDKFQFDSEWKEDFLESIRDIKGFAHGIFKSFTSTDDMDYSSRTKENYLEDMEMMKKLVDVSIYKLRN